MESTGEVVRTTGGSDGGVPVARSYAPSDFHKAPRSETSNPPSASVTPPPPPQNSFAPPEGFSMKKKRGRPRKYGQDGAAAAVAVALSPNPISSAAPTSSQVIDFSASEKRGKVKPATPTTSFIKTKYQVENLDEWVPPSSDAARFTPHIITVNAGEDLTKSIISFSQEGDLAICVLSANGVVSSVTLRQPGSSGGTLTYEGRFEILSLSGTFMPSDFGGTRIRSGGLTVSLASPDGRVVGGGIAGLLVAATPIQVVIGSFLAQEDHNPKRPMPTTSSNPPDHGTIHRPISSSSSLRIGTWSPSLGSDPRHKPSHDINIALT